MTPTKVILNNGRVVWKERVRENGRRPEIRAGTRSELDELVAEIKRRERRRERGLPAEERPPEQIEYDALCDKFLDRHRVGLRWKGDLRQRLSYSRKEFGSSKVTEIRTEDVAQWFADLKVGDTMREHILKAMRQVCDAGAVWGYLHESPVTHRKIKAPAPSTRPMRPFESWVDVHTVAARVAHYGPRYGPLVPFAVGSGLRPQEWRAVWWEDVNFDKRELYVRRAVQSERIVEGSAKNPGSLRTVQLQRVALDALRELPRPLAGGLIFPSARGGILNMSNFHRDYWKPAFDDLPEIGYRAPGQMRHTFATLALDAGAPIEWVSRQMGHTSIEITLRRYAKFLRGSHDRNLALLDAYSSEGGRKEDAIAEGSR